MNTGRVNAAVTAGVLMVIISTSLFGTTTGLSALDVLDKFINTCGIVAANFVCVLAIVLLRKLLELRNHLDALSSIRVGRVWAASVVATVVVLGYMLYQDAVDPLKGDYSGYPDSFLNIFGWGMVSVVLVLSVSLSSSPWEHGQGFNVRDEHEHKRKGEE